MMEFKYISIIVSFLLGILVIRLIRRYDVYEKEPFLAMFLVTVLGGAASIFLAKMLYIMLAQFGVQYKHLFTFWGMFVFVGPVEELSKLITLFAVYPFIKRKMNEMNDGIIYMSCIALGFSLIENYQYANSAPGYEYLIILRLFISTPMHIAFSSFMGLAFYKVVKEKKNIKLIFFAFIWASLLHGIFDGVLTLKMLYFMVLFVIFIIISQNMIMLRMTNMLSPFRPKFKDILENSKMKNQELGTCPKCQAKQMNDSYHFRKIKLSKCANCGVYFSTRKSMYDIFRFFAPSFKKISRQVYAIEHESQKIYTLKNCVYFNDKKKSDGYFSENNLIDYFETHKNRTVEKFQTSVISPAKYFAFY